MPNLACPSACPAGAIAGRDCAAAGGHPGFADGDGRRSSTGGRQARGAAGRHQEHTVAETGGRLRWLHQEYQNGPAAKLPDLPRTAKQSKPIKEPNSAGGPWARPPEDVQLKRKLTICRDCK